MRETIDYILHFLLRDPRLVPHVGYTSDVAQWNNYKVIILPSRFFSHGVYGTSQSMPSLPLRELEGMPVLFGDPLIEHQGGRVILHADLVAGAFFLVSRYEEYLFPDSHRDVHGRFIGKESLPCRARFIHRPLVEEYGEFLRNLLRQTGIGIPATPDRFSHVYLTHDVDTLTNYRRLRGAIGGTIRALLRRGDRLSDIIRSQAGIRHDPVYTFPWIRSQDNRVSGATPVYFIKAASPVRGFDYPAYNLRGADFRRFVEATASSNSATIFGLHCSYASGSEPQLIQQEQSRLQQSLAGHVLTACRHHYLRSLQPDDMMQLLQAGLTDDFTMGYADVAGFRLGTCRDVRFINPASRQVTRLTLHPLTVMDCTLHRPQYMNLSHQQALDHCLRLMRLTRQYNGSLTLLWHNTTFAEAGNYHQQLYTELINALCQ